MPVKIHEKDRSRREGGLLLIRFRFRFLAGVLLAQILLAGAFGCGGPALSAQREPWPMGTIAYIYQGDLWVRDLPAGAPRRLTQGGGHTRPQWSPSGSWLLVYKGQETLAIRADGAAARPVPAGTWAPNRDRLAYRDEQGRIGVIGPEESEDRVLAAPAPGESLGSPAWSPDGRWIAYVAGGPGREYTAIRRVPASEGAQQDLYVQQGGEPQCIGLAGWTPDSGAVLFFPHPLCSNSIAADGLRLMMQPVSGGPPQVLVDTMLVNRSFLAPSSAGLLAAAAGSGRMTWERKRILVVNPQTGKSAPASPEGMAAIFPAWAPDGERLAYIAMPEARGVGGGEPARRALMARRVWVARADGSEQRPLTDDPAWRDESPAWTGDGGHILFCRLNGEARASLWLVAARGGTPVKVADLDPFESWFGYYGYVDCSSRFAQYSRTD